MASMIRMRRITALLLAMSAALFTAGTVVERSGHTESAAEHAAESPVAPTATPTSAPAATPTGPAGSRQTPRPVVSPTRDPGLSAPEGSPAREAAERRKRHPAAVPAATPPVTARATRSATADAQAPEGSAAREAPAHNEATERLFGINTESIPVIVAADALAVLLIAFVLALTGPALRWTAWVVAASSAGAVGLDLREALHQHDLGRNGLVALVAVVGASHLATGAAGLGLIRRSRS